MYPTWDEGRALGFRSTKVQNFNHKIIPNPTQNHNLLCVSKDTRKDIQTSEVVSDWDERD